MDFSSISSFRNYVRKNGLRKCVADWNIIPSTIQCVKCGGTMHINKASNGNLGYRCGANRCRSKKNVRDNTFFGLARIPPETLLCVLIAWILKYPISIITKETELNRKTTSKLISEFREILTVWLLENSTKIGGIGETVEIDESAFGKRKYNRGRVTKIRWVVGGIDRTSKKCFLKIVNKRDAGTLLKVISENVQPGTTIITDMWRGYNSLDSNGYSHLCVNHSLNFVCPGNANIHTQNIESHWAKMKRDMRRRVGRMSVSSFESYLVEYTWRNIHTTNEELFTDFLRAIKYFYP